MYVQDLRLGINAAAEISKQEANNFKEMCREFAASNLHDQIIDEYLSKLSQARAVGSKSSLSGACPRPTEACSSSISSISSISTTSSNASAPTTSNCIKRLEDAVKVDEILKSTIIEMNLILARSNSRIQNEQEIIGLLSVLLTAYDSTVTAVPFGSTTYGFGGKRTNFNILVTTGCVKLLFAFHPHFLTDLTETLPLQAIYQKFMIYQHRSKIYLRQRVYSKTLNSYAASTQIVFRANISKFHTKNLALCVQYILPKKEIMSPQKKEICII